MNKLERTLMPTSVDITGSSRELGYARVNFTSVEDKYFSEVICCSLVGLPLTDARLFLKGGNLRDARFKMTITEMEPAAPELLTQAAIKAKSGDTKEAVRLAIEALQMIAAAEK